MLDWLVPQTVETKESPFNGQIQIVRYCGKISLRVGGFQQSGEMVKRVWEKGLSKILDKSLSLSIRKTLVLGLGAGTIVPILEKQFPNLQEIVGVEIDPVMIDLGKKYFGLGKFRNLKIITSDAAEFTKANRDQKFDLIIADLYLGQQITEEISSGKLIENLMKILAPGGKIVINVLDISNADKTHELIRELEEKLSFKKMRVDYNWLLFNSIHMNP